MRLSEVLGGLRREGDSWAADVPDDWMQGRSVFGGLQAALAVRVMRGLAPAGVPLRVVQVTFAAPVPAGTLSVRARVLRAGKSATHVEARLVDGKQTSCLAVGIFGRGRASRVDIVPRQPAVRSEQPLDFRHIPGLTPSFTQHFTMQWLQGALPFSGARDPRAVIEVGIEDAATTSEEHVIAIADAIPPVALSLLETPAPGSSMTWTLEMLSSGPLDRLPLAGWRLDAEIVAAREGYTSQSVMVWGPGGEAVALSRQSMVVFG